MLYAHIVGYFTREAIICVDCIDEFGDDAEFDEDSLGIWTDDNFDSSCVCDYCGTDLTSEY